MTRRRLQGVERRKTKDGWVYRVRWQTSDGRKRSATFDTPQDALDHKAGVRLAKRQGDLDRLDAGQETLAAFVADYWTSYAAPNLARNTLKTYAAVWNTHGLPRLGHLQMREITPKVVARFRADLERDGVGAAAISKTMTMLQSVFARAVEWERVRSNPLSAVRKPVVKPKPAKPMAPQVIEQIRARLTRDGADLVSVMAYAGLRPEEALGLQWRDVGQNTLLVERAVVDGHISGLKTGGTGRTVDLLAVLRGDLKERRLIQGRPAPKALIFPGPDGDPWNESRYRNWRRRQFQPAARAAGVEDPKPYLCRRSFASLMIHERRLTIVELASQLGHSPTMLLDTYAGVISEMANQEPVSADEQVRQARQETNARRATG